MIERPTNFYDLSISHVQLYQPWTVPYSPGVQEAVQEKIPHILGSHCVLHTQKSVGKLADVFEALDHSEELISEEQREVVKAMAADLMTAALRFANLYGFDLAVALEARVFEKNGVTWPSKLV